MLRLLLPILTLMTVEASHLSWEGVQGLHNAQPKLISQSIGLREVPTKVIKITKTVAIKVPVPYPVKVPHHIPIPVPVNRPVPIPVPQIVKVPHHVPIEVSKPVPVELHQQVPLIVSRPIPVPQPIHVAHPVNIDRPVFYPVPHGIPYRDFSNEHDSYPNHGSSSYGSDNVDNDGHASRSYTYYTVDSSNDNSQPQEHSDHFHSEDRDFRPSQPDYASTDH